MKKSFLTLTLIIIGGYSFASSDIENSNESIEVIFRGESECVTQTSTDSDGDTVSVTCCRTTFDEAYDCAASKLKAAVKGIENGLE